MKENHHMFGGILVVGFLLVALAIFFAPQPSVTVEGSGSEVQKNSLSVRGESQFDVDPDEAEIYVRVSTEEPTAKRAQEENARLMNTVMAALENEGINKDQMETTNYNLWPQTKWDPELRESVKTGYSVQHLLKITTDDVTSVGDILDVAVANGANGLDRVNFKISDDKMEDVNGEALAQASSNAKEKAQAIAQGVGVRLGKINLISESNVNYASYPRPMYAGMAMEDSAERYKSTTISPESVTVSAYINIVYNIE